MRRMRFDDIIRKSVSDLGKNKLRTGMTILGVLIGTASVVTCLSIAAGYRTYVSRQYGGESEAVKLTVTNKNNYASDVKNTKKLLSDERVKDISAIAYVDDTAPELDFNVNFKYGRYRGSAKLKGIQKKELDKITLISGRKPYESGAYINVLTDSSILNSLFYSESGNFHVYDGKDSKIIYDFLNDVYFYKNMDYDAGARSGGSSENTEDDTESESDTGLTGSTSAYEYRGGTSGQGSSTSGKKSDASDRSDTSAGSGDNNEYERKITKGYDPGFSSDSESSSDKETLSGDSDDNGNDSEIHFKVKVCGLSKKENTLMSDTQGDLITDIDILKDYLASKFGKNNVPNQPTVNGRPAGEWIYQTLVVRVDDPEHVAYVTKKIKKMGFNVSGNKALIDSARRNTVTAGVVFGAFGMIALVVAVIGMANTMMMSVYERTREIGIMKITGCLKGDINRLFLTEAALIGIAGSAAGCILAKIISVFINRITSGMNSIGTAISSITPALVAAGMVFVILTAVISGILPARRAAGLDPLEALKRN